jgi:adenylate cyclase
LTELTTTGPDLKFVEELRNRNIPRVAVAYLLTSWVVIQIADTIFPNIGLSANAVTNVIYIAAIGFIPFLIFAWLFEFTPEGLKLEKDVARTVAVSSASNRKLDLVIIITLMTGLGYFVFDKFVLDPRRDQEMVESAVKIAVEEVEQQASAISEQSVAVLPFVNMSSDPEQEYFGDGLAEELLNLLARIPELHVAARTSSFSFKGEKVEIPTVAQRLRVAYVLEGSVRKSGNQVRVTAQLIRGKDGYHLLSETWDRELNDIFGVQDEIAALVVESLKLKLLGPQPRSRVVDSEAYSLFLQGLYFDSKHDAENWVKSVTAYRGALDIDPEYAEAWAGLSLTLAQQANWGAIDLDDGMMQAREAAQHALALDENLPMAHTSIGWIYMVYDWDWYAADAAFKTATRLAPSNPMAVQATGWLALVLGHLEEAVELSRQAIGLDPLRQSSQANLGLALIHAGRLDEATERYQHLLALNPQSPGTHMRLGQILLLQGYPEQALEMILQDSDAWWQDYAIPLALHSLGRQDEADLATAKFLKEHTDGPFQAAEIFAWRGELDTAFEWLERAYKERDAGVSEMMNDPFLANLMDDDRWQLMLDKVGLGNPRVSEAERSSGVN